MTKPESATRLPEGASDRQVADAVLRLPVSAQSAERPEAFLEYVADALESLLPVRVEIHWADVDVAPPLPSAPHHVRLNVRQQEAPYATVDVVSAAPLGPHVQFALEHLADDLTLHVDAMTIRRMRALVRELRVATAAGADLEAVSQGAVDVAVRHMGAEAAVLLLSNFGKLQQLAVHGQWSDEPEKVAQLASTAQVGLEALGPMGHADAYVTVPITSSRPARCVLVLRFAPHRQVHSLTYPVLAEMASVAAPVLDARWRDRVFTELLELNRAAEDTSTAEMYGRVLATALRLVPGADSGTLLTRSDPDEPFRFQAAVGFDIKQLAPQPISEEAARAWYGADDDGWHQGVPRVLSRTGTNIHELGTATTAGADPAARQYDQITATLCLPVLRDGYVMAVLNLDNLRGVCEFGADSTQLAYLFGAPLASLLHRQNTRDLLRKAALTDELTGLANRRAFNEALARELKRAQRGGVGPSLLHMDLKGFKAINDTFGHDVGDEVLSGVAAAIRSNVRTIDVPVRYGGDEFVALLVDTPHAEALKVAERIQSAVAHLDVGNGPIHIDIGVASCEQDGADGAQLIRIADKRMYAAKRTHW